MKIKLILISLLLTFYSCKAQIIPVEEHTNYLDNEIEIPGGTYFKDVNNILDKYIGTWKGNYQGNIFEFRIVKLKNNFLGISVDKLHLRYKITDNNGNTILDTTNLPSSNYLVVKGRYLSKEAGYYVLSYVGEGGNCGQHGDIFISVSSSTPTSMTASLNVGHDMVYLGDCPNGIPEQIIPTEQFTLTKQ